MRFNVVNVLDTERTCYENGVFPPGQREEVIEFGLCMVDVAARKIIKTVSIPVIPTMSQVSPYCTALTGWTQEKLRRQGVPFPEAIRRLAEKYGARNRLLVTDSNTETRCTREQCDLLGIEFPFGDARLNVSTMFALLACQRRNVGLEQMARMVGLELEGTLHRGSDDARNIARIFLKVLEKCSFTLDSAK